MLVPNNIGLRNNDLLTKQLVAYQTKFRYWWRERGPAEFLDQPMQLRRPTGIVQGADWTAFHTMKPSEYSWGIYMVPTEQEQIAFGKFKGQQVWNTVPAEYRSLLLDHIRVQADVENAAIEQSRNLTQSAPSQFDLNNLFQFFLEEGRHTWAMVHLLIEYFGHDGSVESEALLERMSGDADNPRLLDAFNYHTDDWLSHFMWCFLADRVGKYQIQAVTQCAFAPLARSAKFMMLEEPLHIKFGALGLDRVLCKSVEVTLREDSHDIFEAGAIPLPVIQKYFNYWTSKIFDLFGNDNSKRAYDLYQCGIRTPRNFTHGEYQDIRMDQRTGDTLKSVLVKPTLATNTVMRRQYAEEVTRILERWNKYLDKLGIDFRLYVPDERFNRLYGPCKHLPYDVNGLLIPPDSKQTINDFLPSSLETSQVKGLMQRELAPDRYASWIAPANSLLRKYCDTGTLN